MARGGTFDVVVCQDPRDLAERVASRLCELARSSARLSVALSGGSTPRRLYETLAREPFSTAIDWTKLELFFGDERSVPPDHTDSNYRMVHDALLRHVAVRAHRMAAERGEAAAYEQLLRERVPEGEQGVPSLDVILLGMGGDGHTASLFPGTPALQESSRLVVMNEVPQLQTRRMTFTYPLINAARRVWLLVTGAGKQDLVRRCAELLRRGESDPRWPITGVHPDRGELLWFADRAAAAEL